MDNTQRNLERAAAQGDPQALERLTRQRERAGQGRHGDKVGQWVVVETVRDHYRGKLLRVTELGAGQAILHLSPAYWQPSLAAACEEHPLRGTVDLYSQVVGAVSLQPEGWPTA